MCAVRPTLPLPDDRHRICRDPRSVGPLHPIVSMLGAGIETKLCEFKEQKLTPFWALVPGREASPELLTCLYLVTICSSLGSSMSWAIEAFIKNWQSSTGDMAILFIVYDVL